MLRRGAGGGSVLLLADDFFLAAHDSISMRCRLTNRSVGLGLAGALLGEQVLYRRVTIRKGEIRVVDSRAPRDALAHTVLHHLVSEDGVTAVRDWLHFLGRDAYEHVTQRLVREGHLRVRQVRRFLRSITVYEPTDPIAAGWPESRIAGALHRHRTLELPDIVLAGLVEATGLDTYVLSDLPVGSRRYLRALLAELPPSLRELIKETEAAVGDAVLSART